MKDERGRPLLDLFGNWRIVDGDLGMPHAEMIIEGQWVFPDCVYNCKYCGSCIGCLRKRVTHCEQNVWELVEDCVRCDQSPTGLHEARLDYTKLDEELIA